MIVIQLAPLAAVQAQPLPAVTPTLPPPPLEVKDALEEESAYVQGAAAWLTVKVWPAMVTVPERAVVFVLAARE